MRIRFYQIQKDCINMNKICPNCKAPVPEEANFCLNCFTNNIRGVNEIHKAQLELFLKENVFSVKNKKEF